MKKLYFLSTLLFFSGWVTAQENFWQKSTINSRSIQILERAQTPENSLQYDLKLNEITSSLNKITNTNQSIRLKFPDAKGNFNTYEIIEKSNFHQDLQAKHNNITAYIGYNIDNPSEKIILSLSPQFGLYGTIDGNGFQYLIDPYTTDKKTYTVYDKNNLLRNSTDFTCQVDDILSTALGIENLNFTNAIEKTSTNQAKNGMLKTYRLAITTTTEYSNFIINRVGLQNGTDQEKKAAILAAVNISMARINGIFRNDVGVHFELIPNTDKLFFITSDQFTVTSANQMLYKNIEITNSIIGANNYDIGHLFFKVNSARQSNGLAITPSVCVNEDKAGGVTGTVLPIGDPFDIDYTAHEIGHQLGAFHTQNNSCNRMSTSIEPGSGSTIMAYTGICEPNVQSNSDAYFHQMSIQQMNSIVQNTNCGTDTTSSNIAPIIEPVQANYNIPHSTAFSLNMLASDTNNDLLTYVWDQVDNEVGETMPPISSNTQGPMFRSFSPSTESERYFPKMDKILANQLVYTQNFYNSSEANYHLNNWEVVPNIARSMDFSGIVRDNNLTTGQTSHINTTVNLQNVGPFKVTSQTTNETWTAGQSATVTWDVAGTNANMINTANVKILVSFDAGQTWDYTLTESTPNNGTYTFNVPYAIGETTNARLMIRPVDNIYLAVNPINFTINSPLSSTEVNENDSIKIWPNPTNGIINIETAKNYNQIIIRIFDLTGKQIHYYNSDRSNSNLHRLALNQIPNGVYIVSINTDNEHYSKKIIIKK